MMNVPVQLYAALYVREFAAQAMLRLRPELSGKPCVILDGEPPLQTVCALNARARRHGVAYGMTRVELETFSSLAALPRSVSEEDATRRALLECAGTFSPRLEDCDAGSAFLCVIDIAGTDKLFGPPDRLAQALLRSVKALGIAASVTVSVNFHAAICCARGRRVRGDVSVIASGQESAALSPLPLSVLGLSEDHAETFKAWGIQSLGALAGLPETELIARIGQAGKRYRQLSRGEYPHLFVPIEVPFELEDVRELDSPVEQLDALLFVVSVMLEQLIVRATARIVALASVTVTLALEGGGRHRRTVRPALPSNDRPLWLKLLHLDLEAHPPPAAILALVLNAEPGHTSKVQLGLFSPQLPEPGRLDITLARIRAIVGEDSVGRAVLKDSHKPDDFRVEPFTVPSGKASGGLERRDLAAMRQLRPAEPLTVTLREGKPVAFSFRGQRYDAEQAYGPWRMSGDWWNTAQWGLEQWDVVARSQDSVMLCGCIVRDLRREQWVMAALYD